MSPVKNIFSVIKAPLVSEKSVADAIYRKYAFWVRSDANKIEIRQAIEKIYNVKVDCVHSIIVKGKSKRLRWNQPGKKRDWKKAIVTLKEGFEIKQS